MAVEEGAASIGDVAVHGPDNNDLRRGQLVVAAGGVQAAVPSTPEQDGAALASHDREVSPPRGAANENHVVIVRDPTFDPASRQTVYAESTSTSQDRTSNHPCSLSTTSERVDEERSPIDFDRLSPDVRRRVARLTKLDNWHAVLGVLEEGAIIVGAVFLCVGVSWWLYPLSLLLIGSSHRSLAHFLHESSHRVLARNPKFNLVLGTYFSGYLIFQMYNPYRNTHVGCHHRNLGDPETDPDYSFHRACGLYDHHQSDARFLAQNVLAALFGLRTVPYVKYLLRDRLFCTMPRLVVSMPIRFRVERRLLFVEWCLLVAGCALGGWLHLLLLLWFAPLVTSGVAVGWLSELAEHYPLPESESQKLLLTRNRHGWAVENFLLGRHGDRQHLTHHLNPGIPFWNLRRAHKMMLEDPGYAAWDDMWAGILTRPRSRRHADTVLTYGVKYRAWRRGGGDPRAGGTSFAELLVRADAARRVNR